MKERGYSENVAFIEKAPDQTSAVGAELSFEGQDLVTRRFQDMEPVLQHVKDMREANEDQGSRWGDGRMVGHIPALFLSEIAAIKDRPKRDAAILAFFRENPAFCGFSPYLKR